MFLAACSAQTSAPVLPRPIPGARLLSISASPRAIPAPTFADLTAAVDLVIAAGARGNFHSNRWSALEPTAGQYTLTDLFNGLSYEASRGFTDLVGIQVINTTAKETPADLLTVPFDSPSMEARFHTLIDSIAPHFGSRVKYLSIGNEVDVYLDATGQWDAYTRFYQDAVAYVHAKAPGVQVGVTTTYGNLGRDRTKMAMLNAASDIIVFTYYPLDAGFQVQDPSAALTALPGMVAFAAGRPVVVQEIGYPADSLDGSTQAKQAEFFRVAIATWASLDAPRMPFMNLFLLHDFPPTLCDQFASYYGSTSPAFKAYLCSLGLRQADDTPRLAWQAVVDAAKSGGIP